MVPNYCKTLFQLFVVHLAISEFKVFVKSDSVFPTQLEQVNLLTNVKELLDQVKSCSSDEQIAMDEALIDDVKTSSRRSILLVNAIEESSLLKLSAKSNAVCSLDAKEIIENSSNATLVNILNCTQQGLHALHLYSKNITSNVEFAIKAGENFLDKLNNCSAKKGLAVIACYKKIIQNDVLPVRKILSEAIESHRKSHVESFQVKTSFNRCIETELDKYLVEIELKAFTICQ